MTRKEFHADVRAVVDDGYKDGLVNSDSAIDDAKEALHAAVAPSPNDVEAQVEIRAAQRLADLDEELADDAEGTGTAQETSLFMLFWDGDTRRGRRPAGDTEELKSRYVAAWKSGFRERLRRVVANQLREDIEAAVARESLKS